MLNKTPSGRESTAAPGSDFTFDSGRLCLDCLATVSDRHGAALERWKTGRDLAIWCLDAGLLENAPHVPQEKLQQARALRECLYQLITTLRIGAKPKARAVKIVNDWAARPTAAPRLSSDGRKVSRQAVDPLEAAMVAIARDALEMIAQYVLTEVRECEGPACSMLFVDESRPGNRRWCSMKRCGNRSKKEAYRKRMSRA